MRSYNDSILGDMSSDDEREIDMDDELALEVQGMNAPKARGRGRNERKERGIRGTRRVQDMFDGFDTND